MVLPFIDMNQPQVYMFPPHPEPLFHLPPCTIPPGHPSAPVPRILYWTWTGNSFLIWYYTWFHDIPPNHSTLSLSHRIQKTVLYICVSFAVSHTGLSLRRLHFKEFSIHAHRCASPHMTGHMISIPPYYCSSFTWKLTQEGQQVWEGKRAKWGKHTTSPSKVTICLLQTHFQAHIHEWHFPFAFLTSNQTKYNEIIKSKNWSVKAASSLGNYQRARNDSHFLKKFKSWSQIAYWNFFWFLVKKKIQRDREREIENGLSSINTKKMFIQIKEFVN